MLITGLQTIWCQTSDMDRSVAFYRDVLGLRPHHLSPYWSDFDLGNGRSGLHPAQVPDYPLGLYQKGWVIGLQTNDLKALRERLEANGAVIHGDYHDLPGAAALDFADPDGNTLQAIQPGTSTHDLY
jgi:catechol 2,3-dioxygenase-like lactoylglutathione lyase family enzyme